MHKDFMIVFYTNAEDSLHDDSMTQMVLDNIPLVDKMERIYVDFAENIPWVMERREYEEEER